MTERPAPSGPPVPARTADQRDDYHNGRSEMWPEMTDLQRRFHELESEFITDPKSAVSKAEQVVQEAVKRLTDSMNRRMQSMHHNMEGKDGDTESLRRTMADFREWIESMGDRRTARAA